MANVPDNIKEYAQSLKNLTAADLIERFNLSRTTADNYLSRLEGEGIIHRVTRGVYAPGTMVQPEPSIMVEEVYRAIKTHLPKANVIVWDALALNPFSHHSILKSPTFVDVPKSLLEPVREALLRHETSFHGRQVFDLSKVSLAEVFESNPILLNTSSNRYATVETKGIRTARAERVWTDLYVLSTRQKYPFDMESLGLILHRMLKAGHCEVKMLLIYARGRGVRCVLDRLLAKLFERNPSLFQQLEKVSWEQKELEKQLERLLRGASDEPLY